MLFFGVDLFYFFFNKFSNNLPEFLWIFFYILYYSKIFLKFEK